MLESLPTAVVATAVFALCFLAMAVGLIIRGTRLRGGCGTEPDSHKKPKHRDSTGCASCDGNSCSATPQNSSKAIISDSTPRS